jgi:hypothetical protein
MMMRELGLKEGEYTPRDALVRDVARKFREKDVAPWMAVDKYILGLVSCKTKKDDEFRKRTSSQIMESGYVNGCTDRALVFLSLIRELSIPALYVEAFDRGWLESSPTKTQQGHVFVEMLVGGEPRVYNPTRGFTRSNRLAIGDRDYVEVSKGVDFGEVYLLGEDGKYAAEPTNLQSLDRVVKMFKARFEIN